MEKKIMPLLILILAASATGQVPTYQLETILPSPHCTSVDLSPDGTKLCLRMQYGSWDEGYREFDAHTYEVVEDHHPLGSAPWRGLISADNQYLWHSVYYGGKVEKLDLSTKNIIVKSLDVGSWTYGLAFDSSRRYLYAGENVPGRDAIGSLQVIDTYSETVVGSVTLNGEPGFHIVVDSLDESVYLVTKNSGTETLYKISTSDYNVRTLALPGIREPGISISPDGATIYVPHSAAGIVYVINTDTLGIVKTWSIDSAVGFFVSPNGTHALVVGNSQDIRVFDLLTETVVHTITIPYIGTSYSPGKSTLYWDGNNGKVYINLCATEGGVAVLVPEPAIEAVIDIKPGSCPNPLNVKSRGVLSVAILGSEDFDVNTFDMASIRLAGVAPIRSSYEDVATPLSDSNECECPTEGTDGFLDLTLKFKTEDIVEAIGEVDHGDELMLELAGVLSDETPIYGSDCIIIRGKHKPINRADFNDDGIVGMADFAAFAENWLQSSIVEY
jgi:WD40 repeat protein